MKRSICFLIVVGVSIFHLYSQGPDRSNDRFLDPQMDQMDFVANEVLVKFRDNVTLPSGNLLKSAGIGSVDKTLKSARVVSLEKLFPQEKQLKVARTVKDPLGRDMVIPSLHNIYKITLPHFKSTGSAPVNILKVVEELKALPEVEFAEPNYMFSMGDFAPAGPMISHLEAMEQPGNCNLAETASGLISADPYYNQQWGIPACNIDDAWNTTTGDSTSVIAILDTGVDWLHPDLAANIWRNEGEIADNGIDDDDNGKIDDIRGWDYINNDNNPMDDNSHGTHVAGIAAAVGNNEIGIAGVNWKAKIMPVKVFQSSGKGDAASIAQGVIYAASNDATVLNMSFGNYLESQTLKNALAFAYATAVLVASAGNDGLCIGPYRCKDFNYGRPSYPAAYSFVLGVSATQQYIGDCGILACWSNFDPDGQVYSEYPGLLNYELKAPGTAIISTIPGGNYQEYSGTSMAAPLVAGAVSLYQNQKPDDSHEMLFGNLIHSGEGNIDLLEALNIIPEPCLDIISFELTDTLDGDGDGKPDAGETIELKVMVRNTWGEADSVKAGIELGDFEDPLVAQIITGEALVGSISAYATLANSQPLRIKISEDAVHNRDIVIKLNTWYGNKLGFKSRQIILNVENGINMTGMLFGTQTLTPDKNWIVTGSFKIADTGILNLKPGTHLHISSVLYNEGVIRGIGTKDSTIYISGTTIRGAAKSGTIDLRHTFIDLIYPENGGAIYFQGGNIDSSKITINSEKGTYMNSGFLYTDCLLQNWSGSIVYDNGRFIRCNFENFSSDPVFWHLDKDTSFTPRIKFCNFSDFVSLCGGNHPEQILFLEGNNFLDSHKKYTYYADTYPAYFDTILYQYWGTGDSLLIENTIFDFNENAFVNKVIFSPYLLQPSDSAHACVWKVLVNGKDAQEEVMDPVGVGRHRFDICFNRSMDKSIFPRVSFGVREPFNQQQISEDGSWSEDGRIFTVYKTVNLTTGDGINRIRISGAREALGWDWEILVETQRFEFLISAAGSASAEFLATPGMGKVLLEWNDNDLEDGLGYNMYRMEQINDSTLSQPLMINTTLITDTLYTDFAVTPNKKYFYYYKILRTNLEETDSSKVVAAIPLTASKGDANGDLTVNVLDVTTIVAHLLENDPQPFIFEAADVNGDQVINVLDIVGVVNLVLNPGKSATIASAATVTLYVQNDTLFADAPVAIGAIQLEIAGATSMEEIEKLAALQGFESGYNIHDHHLRLIVYSLTGKTIPAGNRIPLLRLKKGSGITDVVMGDKTGKELAVSFLSTRVWSLRALGPDVATLGQNYPNPLEQSTTIPVTINEPVDEITIRIIGINGQEIAILPVKNPVIGENLIHWTPGNHKGLMAYLLEVRRGGQQSIAGVKKMLVR